MTKLSDPWPAVPSKLHGGQDIPEESISIHAHTAGRRLTGAIYSRCSGGRAGALSAGTEPAATIIEFPR
ncbi:hypothetical protein, partial [Mesorhizobium sp. M1A.F.Ca.IN.020.03.2.1]|uniref:hypothetical protein n=1 Tax=Mesorhizobium sp. M1A.F.Ca.IN.020.03.2.1 TaxID=2496769 RepID=UPI0019D4579D